MAFHRDFLYYKSNALQSIRRNIFINIISIGIIGISLIFFGVFSVVAINFNNLIEQWKERIQVTAYLEDGLSKEGLQSVEGKIKAIEGVKEVEYLSKGDAYRTFKEELKGLESILEGLTENPLPASFEIKLKKGNRNSTGVNKVVLSLRRFEEINDVHYGGEWLDRFSTVLFLFKLIGLGLVGFLFFCILFIISNTIRLSLFSRRKEIEIMKLIGATDNFIRIPFIIEGFLQGLIGSLIAVILLFLVHSLFFSKISIYLTLIFGSAEQFVLPNGLMVSLILIGAGLGILGSIVSVGRHLRVIN